LGQLNLFWHQESTIEQILEAPSSKAIILRPSVNSQTLILVGGASHNSLVNNSMNFGNSQQFGGSAIGGIGQMSSILNNSASSWSPFSSQI
jgi:hypothetical protein